MRGLICATMMLLGCQPAAAQGLMPTTAACGPSDAITKLIIERFDLSPIYLLLVDEQQYIVLWMHRITGVWSLVSYFADGSACVRTEGAGSIEAPAERPKGELQ